MIRISTALALLLFFVLTSTAQTLDAAKKAQITQNISQYIDQLSPGMAIGVVQEGHIVYENYLGYSNLENQTQIDASTRFNIASNGKQFTALCILKLIEDGQLSLQDDLRAFFPELYKNIPSKITIAQLLNHTSGVRDIYGLWSLKGKTWWQLFIDNQDAMDLLRRQSDLNFEPGTQYLYSNSNYILLAEIIKVISKKPFADFALQLFKDLGMNETSFLSNYMAIIPNRARPYGDWNGWKEYPTITEIHGDGGLFTTLRDQLKWEQIIQNNNGAVLSKSMVEKSQHIHSPEAYKNYGFGLMFDRYKGQQYSYHDGNTGAYNATFLRFPESNLAVVIMSNNAKVPTHYLAKQITDIVLDLSTETTAYPSGPEQIIELSGLKEITGNYLSAERTIIKIVAKEGQLYREIYGRDPVRLINEKGGLFYYETIPELKINFTKTLTGEPTFTIYMSSQEPNIGTKLPDSPIDEAYKKSLDGHYYNKETDTEVQLTFTQDNTYTVTKNGRSRDGALLYKDFLMMNSYEISVRRDTNGAINGLLVNNGRIQNVVFDKLD